MVHKRRWYECQSFFMYFIQYCVARLRNENAPVGLARVVEDKGVPIGEGPKSLESHRIREYVVKSGVCQFGAW